MLQRVSTMEQKKDWRHGNKKDLINKKKNNQEY